MRKFLVLLALVGAFAFFLAVPEDDSNGLTLGPPEGFEASLGRPAAMPSDAEAVPGAEVPKVAIHGRVVRVDGEPVQGVRVALEHAWVPEVSAVSGEDGNFQLIPAELRGDLVSKGPNWLLLGGERSLIDTKTDGYLLVVAEPVTVRGRVVDMSGGPVEGARIWGHPPTDAMVSLGIASLPIESEDARGYSGADGTFVIGPIPDVPRAQIDVVHQDYSPSSVPMPLNPAQEILIVLEGS